MDKTDDLAALLQERNLLFDFYGPMLTERQAACFTMRYVEDNSLTEIAEALNISPQAVVDFINRSVSRLKNYEEKLGLVRKFEAQQDMASNILAKLDELEAELSTESVKQETALDKVQWIRAAIEKIYD